MEERANAVISLVDGGGMVPDHVHPLPDLLRLDAPGVLAAMVSSQRRDFLATVAEVEQGGSALRALFDELAAGLPSAHSFRSAALFRPGALRAMFLDLHDHVMSHPVWLHPFFVRVFEARLDRTQATAFAVQYFNQIKNTRQCVAMAIGRFHGLAPLPYSALNERVSEILQITLAQLVSDEYGVGAHAPVDHPDLAHLMRAKTHIAMYRQFLDGLGVPAAAQDVPMLTEVADNVLTQRLVASHPAFSPLEALASVGLGMEWGVPEFFSLLLGGLIRLSERETLALTPRHLEVFIEHVRSDVLHAVSVTLATSLLMRTPEDRLAVKGACNTLMASRYDMMSGLYRHVFGERCATLAETELSPRHRLRDRRIESALLDARRAASPECVIGSDVWRESATPFVFA
jgi:pyrroloquinoline quinone (PQQ) biosynthesis protein C